MRRMGESQSYEADMYLPESLKTERSPYIFEASKELKSKVKSFLNGRNISDLSSKDKGELEKIISDNEGQIQTITNPELGKSKNFLAKQQHIKMQGF
jgi:hypothetical protein